MNTDPKSLKRVLWQHTATPIDPFPALNGAVTADCAIIGAGFTGLSAALHLAAKGRSVVVVEAQQPGFGASGRNAGGYLPMHLGQSPADIEKRLGRDVGHRLNIMIGGSEKLVRSLIDRYEIQADLNPSGIIIGAHNRAAAIELDNLRKQWSTYGLDIDALSRDDMRRLTRSDKFGTGIAFKDAGTLNPLSYVRGLARAATREGAAIYGQTPALGLSKDGLKWQVRTEQGSVTAQHVLIATDAYAANETLWPGLEKTYYRIPMAMIGSSSLAQSGYLFHELAMPISDLNKANHLWMMQDPGQRLVASLLPLTKDDVAASDVAKGFMEKLKRLYGHVAPIQWDYYWIGIIGMTPERYARALRLAPGVHAVGGYSGQGITPATAAGKEYADFIVGGVDEKSCNLPFMNMKPLPMLNALPGILRSVVIPLGRALDRAYIKPFPEEK